jgi:glucosamine--fructose-6-phosphate aminotransferase (isomerizing)
MGSYTWKEITNQDVALQKTFELMENFKLQNIEENQTYVFAGCGTSFYLAHSAAKYFQKVTGKTAIAVPGSEVFMDEQSIFSNDTNYQLIAISRSGTTSEVVKVLEYVKGKENINTLAITCNKESVTADLADQAIILEYINEKSVVMTQSFSSMLFALQVYACLIKGDLERINHLKQVPSISGELLKQPDQLQSLVEDSNYSRYVFLGSSIMNGIAKEATLKLKEMTQTECESYSNLEFRHGPMSIVDSSTVVVLLSSDATLEFDQSLIEDIQRNGGKVVVFSKQNSPVKGDITLSIPTLLPSDDALVAFMPRLQLLAYHKAIALNLKPDEPRNLTQVVKLHFNHA